MNRADLERIVAEKYPVKSPDKSVRYVEQCERAAYLRGRLDQAEEDAWIAEDPATLSRIDRDTITAGEEIAASIRQIVEPMRISNEDLGITSETVFIDSPEDDEIPGGFGAEVGAKAIEDAVKRVERPPVESAADRLRDQGWDEALAALLGIAAKLREGS